MSAVFLKHLKTFAVAASVALLAACGGGGEDVAVTPAQAAKSMQQLARPDARPLPPMNAITPQAAAAKIFAFAELHLGALFNGGTPTMQAGPFAFRYYASTGLYLGVVTVPNMGYELNGVYVLGGSFGMTNPYYAGQASLFVDTSDTPPPVSGNKNLLVQVSIMGISSPVINVGLMPVPPSQADFCNGLAADTTFSQITAQGGGTMTINSCSFNGTVGTIAATMSISITNPFPFTQTVSYTITYTYQ